MERKSESKEVASASQAATMDESLVPSDNSADDSVMMGFDDPLRKTTAAMLGIIHESSQDEEKAADTHSQKPQALTRTVTASTAEPSYKETEWSIYMRRLDENYRKIAPALIEIHTTLDRHNHIINRLDERIGQTGDILETCMRDVAELRRDIHATPKAKSDMDNRNVISLVSSISHKSDGGEACPPAATNQCTRPEAHVGNVSTAVVKDIFEKTPWPRFKATEGEDIDNFLFDYNNACSMARAGGWDDVALMKKLVSLLEGPAKTWARSRTEDGSMGKWTLKAALDALRKAFTLDKSKRSQKIELHRIKQSENESVITYAYRLTDKVMHVKADMDEEDKVFFFLEGLKEPLRAKVIYLTSTMNSLTLEGIVDLAHTVNTQLSDEASRSAARLQDKLKARIQQVSVPREMLQDEDLLQGMAIGSSSYDQTMDDDSMPVFAVRSDRGVAPVPTGQPVPTQYTQQYGSGRGRGAYRPEYRGNGPTCFFCGKPGHVQARCRFYHQAQQQMQATPQPSQQVHTGIQLNAGQHAVNQAANVGQPQVNASNGLTGTPQLH